MSDLAKVLLEIEATAVRRSRIHPLAAFGAETPNLYRDDPSVLTTLVDLAKFCENVVTLLMQ